MEHQESRRRSSTDVGPVKTIFDHISGVLHDMEGLGIVTQMAGKVVGGVALTQSYYQHALATEGKAEEGPACQLLITKRHEGSVIMLPVEQAQLEQGHQELPRESPVLSKIMSPAALTELHWSRVPAVAIFGCFVADEEELQEATTAGLPISPSMTGPHQEELMTQMEVFFKQHKYPENKCFILRDWGFLIFGSDLADAIVTFNQQLKETLVITSESGDKVSGAEQASAAAGDATESPKTLHGVLANAFRRLQAKVGMVRTQSLPSDDGPADGAGIKGLGDKPQFQAASEPSSPMISAEQLPDSIRNISTLTHRKSCDSYRVPSFQTGFKPW